MLDTALDAVIVMDEEGIVRGWNDVATQIFGFSRDEAIGRRMGELIVPARFRDAHEEGLRRYLDTGEGPVLDQRIEIEAACADGREIPIELSITHSRDFGASLFIGFLRDISERQNARRRREMMINELNHRVKNLLGIVSGIAHQTQRHARSLEDFSEAFSGRLAALGRSHELLTQATWGPAPIGDLMAAITQPYDDEDGRIAIGGDDILLDPKRFIGLGMIAYELQTNAVKYGALSHDDGRLEVSWHKDGKRVVLIWRESGREAAEPERQGFGMRMIDMSASHDLAGETRWDWGPDGLRFELAFDLD